ncbi:MAG: hypothetical protein FWD61_15125 [Phycisphaerales bacterium]|nr:hypothetical protein [Phycisphaerales bacterium]
MRTGIFAPPPLIGFLVLTLLAASLPAAENPLLSADEVKKLAAAGQYQDALKALGRILELRGPAAAGYDHYEMLMLRAECLLQTKQSAVALDAIEVARKEAFAVANDDQVMASTAFAALIKASPGGTYTPTTGSIRKPIPITDLILRKAAYNSLLADQLVQINVKVRNAKVANQLKPIAEAAQQTVNLRAVEKASTGGTKQTDQILSDLATISQKMLSTATDDLATDAKKINDAANRLVTENVMLTDALGRMYNSTLTHRAGPTAADIKTLKHIITESGKIASAANDCAAFFVSGDPVPFKTIASKAQTTAKDAQRTLDDDYTSGIR